MTNGPRSKNAAPFAAQHEHSALQHERKPQPTVLGPRPLPLFLNLVQQVAGENPDSAQRALKGLRQLQMAAPPVPRPTRPVVALQANTALHDYGGTGPIVVFVPSLINPPDVLDISTDRSMLDWLSEQGLRPMLLNWGAVTADMAEMSISDYIADILVPLLQSLDDPVHLVGYCLGGTMAMAAAQLASVRSLTLIATPWHFAHYPEDSRLAMARLWQTIEPMARTMGLLPMEALQALFWTLDVKGTVEKYARFAALEPGTAEADLFVAMEVWANGGEPLTHAAARQLFEDLIAEDKPGQGGWVVGGGVIDPKALQCPVLQIVSTVDQIVPASTAAQIGRRLELDRGHVGMITGGQAQRQLWEPLRDWLLQPE